MKRSRSAVMLRMYLGIAAVLGCATAALADLTLSIPGAVKESVQHFSFVHVDRMTVSPTVDRPRFMSAIRHSRRQVRCIVRNRKLAKVTATGNVTVKVARGGYLTVTGVSATSSQACE